MPCLWAYSVPPYPFMLKGGGVMVEPPTKFSKRSGLTGPQLLEGGCWEIGGDFFRGEGGCKFHKKKKKKNLKYLMTKKVYKQKYYPRIQTGKFHLRI